MKKFILSLLAISLSFSLFAAGFSLRLYDYGIFDMTFDHEQFYDIDGSIALTNVSPGKHYLKVLKYRVNPHGHVVGVPRLLFEGMIHISAGRMVSAVIDRYGRYRIEDDYVVTPEPYVPAEPPVYLPPYMSDADFGAFMATLDRASFESSRLTLAKQVAASNVLTSHQVMNVMEAFSFESSRLEFAKYAYPRVYDPQKYYIVNNAFTFSSSISSLDRYVASFQ